MKDVKDAKDAQDVQDVRNEQTAQTGNDAQGLSGQPPQLKGRNKALWSLLSLAIALATVWAVTAQSRAFSFHGFIGQIMAASKGWLMAAFAGMVGFIFFEGEALRVLCQAFGRPARHRDGFAYSAADIFFSSITPSATGGQPACAYFMIRDGIPGVVATVALIVNLAMYTLAILALGLIAVLLRPGVFGALSLPSKVLIVVGYVMQGGLAAFFFLLLAHRSLLHSICRKGLSLLCRLKLVRRGAEKQDKLDRYMEEYARYAAMIQGHRSAMIKTFCWNLLQRLSIIMVAVFVFLAYGGSLARAVDVWAVQCYAVIGSNAIPIPGAMGVSDYLLLDGFGNLLPLGMAVNFELLSRSVSFYVCVCLCGLTTLIKQGLNRKGKRGNI